MIVCAFSAVSGLMGGKLVIVEMEVAVLVLVIV